MHTYLKYQTFELFYDLQEFLHAYISNATNAKEEGMDKIKKTSSFNSVKEREEERIGNGKKLPRSSLERKDETLLSLP